MKIYVGTETSPRKTYELSNGYWYDDEDELTITLNDLNINQNGVYNIITKFKPKNSENEITLNERWISYKYQPLSIDIDDAPLKTDDTVICIHSDGDFLKQNATLNIYVNNDVDPRKSYNLTNGYWDEDEQEELLEITLMI